MTDQRPNVVVLFSDQQRADTTGMAHNPADVTWNFDRMATHGTWSPYAFTVQPLCAPSRAAVLTGTYPTTNGVHRNGLPLTEDVPTMGRLFRDAGYETFYVGKWHLADADPVPRHQQGGFEHWLGANLLEFSEDAFHTRVFDADGAPHDLPGYRSDALIDAVIRFVTKDRDPDRPFFVFCSVLEPHHQNEVDAYLAPDAYAERYQGVWQPADLVGAGSTAPRHLAGYLGQVKRVDEGLGRLLDALRSVGEYDDTVVVQTSDHGCHFKTRNNEYKRSGHAASTHVPLAFRGPCFDGGGRVEELCTLLDVAPTLLDAAGIDRPAHLQGRSILDVLRTRGTRADPGWREDVYIQVSESQVGRTLRTARWSYGIEAPGAHARDDAGSDTYVESYLYDVANDPAEQVNLIASQPHRVVADELRERIVAAATDAGEQPYAVEAFPPPYGAPFGP
ncbi:sulfatase [Beutenbergia cavernae DSM 12333]|uniref:Sulfatase n=1 Tax=Beutenbergia cavernae (strain ATCC BAA-8 / DSM 12333 / CCUG 43141 / JCM 11478 / NBRC 16432 / NCIMB 13614 / HKI 0122) TaxID=471853 RepID=C5BXG2_BEUC1|nr:sulfatase-like hydrolase/transferase [Beutenbergia cavernae]ACQ80845.1 sulfatase [Beutenbergia cavernae DSM 12333]